MAVYREADLLTTATKARLISLKKHLKSDTEEPHTTSNCEYCNEFAKDSGLFPDALVDID